MKTPAKTPAKKAPVKATVAKKAPAKKVNPSKPAPGFKPSAWWDSASDGRRKAYVLRHPKGDYAKAFAKKFGLKYDDKTGLDEKTIAKVKVKGEKNKLKIDMKEEPKPEAAPAKEETKEASTHTARRVEALRRKKAIHIAGSRLAAHRSKIVSHLRKEDAPVAKQAEHALDDLKEEKPLSPERKKSLHHIAKKMGKMALLALGAVALFTPLAPVALSIGAEYLQQRFGDSFAPKGKDDDDSADVKSKKRSTELDDDEDESGHAQKKAEVPKAEKNVGVKDEKESTSAEGSPTTLEGMYTDMCSWLLKQDPSKLAQKLKKDNNA